MDKAINYTQSEMSKRIKLADAVPLEKPFTVNFSVSNVCNLRCEYCTFNNPIIRKQKMSIGNKGFMDMDLFKKGVDDIKKSFGKIKQIILVGSGEPLLHPEIANMVYYIKEKDVTDRIDVITNAVGLTEKLSEQLIKNGLTYLRISVNGLSDDDFYKYTGVKVDFENYVARLRDFYKQSEGKTKVYIKIINYMVETEEKQKKFFEIFSPICDVINIENLHTFGGYKVDYGKIVDISILNKAKYYSNKFETKICSVPFYYTCLDVDGSIYPCCEAITDSTYAPLGNINNDRFGKIWDFQFIDFQKKMLNGMENVTYCTKCTSSSAWVRPDDILDDNIIEIKKRYDELERKAEK